MTSKLSDEEQELIDLRTEIYALREALNPSPIKVPKGTTGRIERGTRGRCVVCDKEVEAYQCIRRCVREYDVVIGKEVKIVQIGYRVCRFCSPRITDWMLERYAINIDDWPEPWKQYCDPNSYQRRLR